MPPSPACLTVIHTGHRRRNGADDRIVQLVHGQPDRAASLVNTSDAKLGARVKALDTQVTGSGTLLRQLATVSGEFATGHSPDSAQDARRDLRVNGELPTTPRRRSQKSRAIVMNRADRISKSTHERAYGPDIHLRRQ